MPSAFSNGLHLQWFERTVSNEVWVGEIRVRVRLDSNPREFTTTEDESSTVQKVTFHKFVGLLYQCC